MNNELIPVNAGLQKYDDKAFELATRSSNAYLDRIQLMTSNSEVCKAGEFPVNHYALIVGQSHKDIGKELDAIILAWRPKAVEFGDNPVTIYDPESDAFIEIAERSAEKDSNCMYGIEFLLWLPNIGEGKFATFFAGSKSARKEAENIKQFTGHGVTFISKKIETAKYTWFIATVRECSSITNVPTSEQYLPVVEAFNNPPENQVEAAPADSGRER